MSDIAGPPAPKPVTAVTHGTDRTAKVSKDPNQTPRQATDDSGGNRSKSEQRDSVHVRDPAVSISASAAHLRVGEELKEHVREIDSEGRPIIITENATFALRPDAGLKPGDDVVIQIAETGKTVAADLLRQNARIIDPPIRLSLVVIALHIHSDQEAEKQAISPDKLDVAYRPTSRSTSASVIQNTANTESEALAKVLGRSNSNQNTPQISAGLADNPDPFIKSNSSDLATLIAAQQTKVSGAPTNLTGLQNQLTSSSAIQASALTSSSSTTHIIPSSPLTDIPTNASLNTASSPASAQQMQGVGPAITAFSTAGTSVQLHLLDLSISQVSPSEVAEVISVQPLPASMARSLPVSAQSLGNEALAQMETSKGSFILQQTAATKLVGEFVRVPDTSGQTAQIAASPNSDIPTYAARLTSEGAQSGRQVQVQLLSSSQPTAIAANTNMQTTVEGVHTIRAFLTGDGPKNDLRIDTALGTLTMTLPSNVRPAVGDTVAILPNSATVASNAVVPPLAVEGGISSSSWPSFEQAYALVQSGAPAAANALNSRSAQGGPKLLNSMMFLMAALKGTSPGGWIGKSASQAIDAKNSALLKLLQDDVSNLFKAGAETASEWRSFLLPFDARSPEMPMLAALFSQPSGIDPDAEHDGGNQAENEQQDQRFVIEVQFSVLGEIQLDGVVRSNKFDLTLWSKQPLPTTLTQDTSTLFTNALAANGFTGAMQFKQSDTFPVDVAAILAKQIAA